MKRVVLQICDVDQPPDAAGSLLDSAAENAGHVGDSACSVLEGGGHTGEIRMELCLTDAQLQDVFGGLLSMPVGDQLDSLASDLVRHEVQRAGPDACDLFERVVGKVERELVSRIYDDCGRTQTLAAQRLGINRNTLHKKLREHHLLADDST